MDDRIGSDLDRHIDIGHGGIEDRHALLHPVFADSLVEQLANTGEVAAGIDPV
jgi:hypothetical protein